LHSPDLAHLGLDRSHRIAISGGSDHLRTESLYVHTGSHLYIRTGKRLYECLMRVGRLCAIMEWGGERQLTGVEWGGSLARSLHRRDRDAPLWPARPLGSLMEVS
jgi:hypothetical protein